MKIQQSLDLRPEINKKGVRIGSLFSGGIDGMIQGFQMASKNYTPIISIDIDKQATDVLNYNYNHTILTKDIRSTSWKLYKNIDGLCITAPCQSYSTARNMNRSKMNEDELIMGKELYLHGFRMLAMVQPEFYIAENVPEFLNYKIPTECFTELRPYDTYIVQADTLDFNLPQSRPRVFFVGFKRKWNNELGKFNPFFHQLYNKKLYIKDILEDNPEIHIPNYIKNRIKGNYRDLPSIKNINDISNTCVAHYAKDQSTTMITDDNGYKGLRPFTVREYARLQGILDSYSFSSIARTTAYKIIGNAVSPIVVRGFAKEIEKYCKYYNINNLNKVA
ncbi:MAG: DNA cytosine methyltransferase [archaeon]